jgi:hypothetical protein
LCKVAEKFEKCAAPVNVIRKYNNLWYDMWLYNNIVALYYFYFVLILLVCIRKWLVSFVLAQLVGHCILALFGKIKL